ncbi:type II toxin-antitoxin system VapC family toxin [Rhizobium sp. AG855]|uniref:type II toxin-antitoxin system VapC family toxin n=1 Tax=Rhizobium sp. AG855 TaxID=2183898 RepID=UPI000E74C27A|nr:type II toxin-antitoxin system VapC family toxin [Rhizobium sp. AG855]RKE83720.1 PIN domain nuclease of toxin-antitoxin system [Rhizobium sp. AG855]
MAGALLDTHALYWLAHEPSRLSGDAVLLIGRSQAGGSLFVSPISAWELALAARKKNNAPLVGVTSLPKWFDETCSSLGARVAVIDLSIALAAAEVVEKTGHKDPGDCYLMATARVLNVPLITRDAAILAIASRGYLKAHPC